MSKGVFYLWSLQSLSFMIENYPQVPDTVKNILVIFQAVLILLIFLLYILYQEDNENKNDT